MRQMISRLELRSTWPQWTLVAIGLASALVLRWSGRNFYNADHVVYYSPWLEHLRADGFAGLATIDANYNPPFLYLLFIGTFLPFDAIYLTKLIAVGFDLVSAVGIGFVIWHWWRRALPAAAVGVAFLFAPEVWLNSSVWGQVDAIHTAFLVWAVWAVLTRRATLMWILFAVALGFKLQAIFFLPVFGIAFILQRHRWWQPLVGLGSYLLLLVPMALSGRPLDKVFGVYFAQAAIDEPLQMNASTMYQWLPDELRPILADSGVAFAIGIVAILGFVYLRRNPGWLQLAAVFGVVVPFVLPSMHDRYFYAGSVFVLILAALDRRYLPAAIALQFTAVVAYGPFIGFPTGTFAVPMPLIALIQLAVVVWLIWLTLSPRPQEVLVEQESLP